MSLFSRKKDNTAGDSIKEITTQIVIPLSAPIVFDSKKFADYLKGQWNCKAAIKEIPASEIGGRRYRLSAMDEMLELSVANNSIPKDLVDATIKCTKLSALPNELTDVQIKEFNDNIAILIIETPITKENGRSQALFTTMVLLTALLHIPETIGYNSISSQMYRPKDYAITYLKQKQFSLESMYVLLGNLHAVSDSEHWVHTHGLEQFGCPDIEVWFLDKEKFSYFSNLVGDSALYIVENGPILKINDTAELAGDGIIYKIVPAKTDSNHEFGRFGAIGIAKK